MFAGVDISLDRMAEVMSNYKIGKDGYLMLVSADGQIIYHPQADIIGQSINDINVSQGLKDAVADGKEQFLKYKANGDTKYGVVAFNESTGYTIISNLPFFEFYSMILLMVVGLIIVFILGMLLIVLNIRRSATNLTKPILELNHTAQQLAAGDLDVELHITAEDEIGELGDSIGETVKRLKEYIVYIDEMAQVLAELADGKLDIELKNDYLGEFQKLKVALLNISNSMSEVMENILNTAGQVSSGASDLANASQVLAEGAGAQAAAVEELVATVVSIRRTGETEPEGCGGFCGSDCTCYIHDGTESGQDDDDDGSCQQNSRDFPAGGRYYPDHRRNCGPDESAVPECFDRSSTGRRGRQGLCCCSR